LDFEKSDLITGIFVSGRRKRCGGHKGLFCQWRQWCGWRGLLKTLKLGYSIATVSNGRTGEDKEPTTDDEIKMHLVKCLFNRQGQLKLSSGYSTTDVFLLSVVQALMVFEPRTIGRTCFYPWFGHTA
jgi:hypothetical protein